MQKVKRSWEILPHFLEPSASQDDDTMREFFRFILLENFYWLCLVPAQKLSETEGKVDEGKKMMKKDISSLGSLLTENDNEKEKFKRKKSLI